MGGSRRSFPETTQGLISRFDPGAAGLEELCRRYWKPVYAYARIAWAKSNEEAKDLAQGFFLWLLEGEALRRYAPERGSFRAYLKVLLERFVGHRETAANRLKRGGGVRIVAIDGQLPCPVGAERPEEAFDRTWLKELMSIAIRRTRERFCSEGREALFRVFEAHDLSAAESPPSYAEVAERVGLKASQVRDHLAAVRREVRKEVLAELARLTAGEPELREEWRALFGA